MNNPPGLGQQGQQCFFGWLKKSTQLNETQLIDEESMLLALGACEHP